MIGTQEYTSQKGGDTVTRNILGSIGQIFCDNWRLCVILIKNELYSIYIVHMIWAFEDILSKRKVTLL